MAASAVRGLRTSPLRPYLSGCLAAMASLSVHGVTDMPLMNTQSMALFVLTMAAMSVVLGPRRGRPGR
jgi:hypothetical protein